MSQQAFTGGHHCPTRHLVMGNICPRRLKMVNEKCAGLPMQFLAFWVVKISQIFLMISPQNIRLVFSGVLSTESFKMIKL